MAFPYAITAQGRTASCPRGALLFATSAQRYLRFRIESFPLAPRFSWARLRCLLYLPRIAQPLAQPLMPQAQSQATRPNVNRAAPRGALPGSVRLANTGLHVGERGLTLRSSGSATACGLRASAELKR